ncbi:MAG: hypothetical protein HFJ30_04195 [Clostridia bacterium]|jgi:hypothetical protein|nr:hypothetical protein [Clostridia bacterium]
MRTGWKIAIAFGIMLLFLIGVITGVYFYEKDRIKDSNIGTKQLAHLEQQENENQVENDVVSTSTSETKLSPNCTITEKQYFKGCDHFIKEIKEIPEEWINFTEEQVKEQYADWKIESLINNEIIVSQEKEGYCGMHYVVREHGEVLGIYTTDETGEETWKEDTDIATRYLTEEDLIKVQEGIKAIGDDQLHSVLEDFE